MSKKHKREVAYRRLDLEERKLIESGLDRKRSIRSIAAELDRSPSSVAREIRRGREFASGKHKGACAKDLPTPKTRCPRRDRSPWCCNGCTSRYTRCSGKIKLVYRARSAHRFAKEKLVGSRQGIDANPKDAEKMLSVIREDLARGLSPAQIVALRSEELGKSASTIYRWIEAGYGDMCNLDLRRKVAYKKRRSSKRRPTSHGKERSYSAFLDLAEAIREKAWEMDCVVGTKYDTRCLLTLFHRPTHLQLIFPLEEQTVESVSGTLDGLVGLLGQDTYEKLFAVLLTDNGSEFCEAGLLEKGPTCKVYYCDVRASNQKGACEKNHVEIRKLLPKRKDIRFDCLTRSDCAYLMSQINSSPRPSLAGLSPIRMFKYALGKIAEALLDGLGVKELGADELDLTHHSLNRHREKEGCEALF